MSYNILTIPPFDNQLKRLAKKYPSLKSDFTALLEILESKPDIGKSIGKNCYKIRLTLTSKEKVKEAVPE